MVSGDVAGITIFEHLLDQIYASARAILLIAQELIGGAGGVAHAAVHATGYDVSCPVAGFSIYALDVKSLYLHRFGARLCG